MKIIYIMCAMFLFASAQNLDEKCLKLHTIDIDETEIFTPLEQEKLLKNFRNQCIDSSSVQKILQTVSQFYMDKGFITTKPYLQEQNIQEGTLYIKVLQGIVEDIIDVNSSQSNAKINTAFLGQKGNTLNLRDLETSLEMINRVPSMQATFEIKPGKEQSSSIVSIKSETTNPYHFSISATGEESLDKETPYVTLHASLDNPFEINDILTFRYNNSDVQERYQSSSGEEMNYSFPLGSYLFDTTIFNVAYKQRIIGLNDIYISSGDTFGTTLKVGKVLFRNQSNKIQGAISLQYKDTNNYFSKSRIDVSSYKTSLAQIDLSHSLVKSWGQLVSTLSYQQGTDLFGARKDNYFNSATQEKLQFTKYTLGTNLYYTFPNSSYQVQTNLHVQLTDDSLYDNNKLSIGSYYTVRGFSSSYYGNNGGYNKNDFIKTFTPNYSPNYLQTFAIFFGLDYGKIVCENGNTLGCGELIGSAIGFRTDAQNLSGEFTWGRSLYSSADIDKQKVFRYNIKVKF